MVTDGTDGFTLFKKSCKTVSDRGGGGTVIAKGTPEEVAKVKESYTGQYVKKYLKK